ncbi:MAG TPA: hypothetical protein DHW38_15270 [Planctomycetaceae bacterium]|nr:hypothetical protein [Rhodopirellula sp.]MCH2360172.1 PfkB family carbohydrate kinase [Pirellulales bacterium]HCK72935.1 hypothetical protein [Planctomycetaceae bacterium]HCP84234.1 hypothetical protein [Planctomycetaceae bacterium]
MSDRFDCMVCGEICVDLPMRTVDRRLPLEQMETVRIDPICPGVGGIVSNSGLVMARLGLRVGAFGYVGDDPWSDLVKAAFENGGLDTSYVLVHPQEATSATAVIVGDDAEHSFIYHSGASRCFDKNTALDHLDLFERTQYALFGYYHLMPNMEDDLPEVLKQVQETGCKTALDTAGGGGNLQPLDRCLPYLDFYIPSYSEGLSQTGYTDPKEMISAYRNFAPNALLGIKLGDKGALLSADANHWLDVAPVTPPGRVVDTTGAGDSFYAGLITGLCNGLDLNAAAGLASATGACCVTQVGAIAGIKTYEETLQMSQI